jgi:hypothetical protein
MPVFKYRRIEDMPSERWLEPGDPAIGRRLRFVCSTGRAFAGPLGIPRGVRKYRSIEEMSADRDRWERARIERIQAERFGK